jgi:predicted anti-sigma-YlaC factor YlaD
MHCADYRELLSAQLDGEATAVESICLEAHLQICTSCHDWAADAACVAEVTDAARIASTVELPPDLADRIVDRLPSLRRRHLDRPWLLRAALCVTGCGQLALGGLSISAAFNTDSGLGAVQAGAGHTHLLRESAAWNAALGVAFIYVALRGGRPGNALTPLLAIYVAFVLGVAAVDLYIGDAHAPWETTHLLALIGLILIIQVSRTPPSFPIVRATRRPRARRQIAVRRRRASRDHAA